MTTPIINPKLGDRKPSEHCPGFCDGNGCYEVFDKRFILGKERETWRLRCKKLDKISNQAMGFVKKL